MPLHELTYASLATRDMSQAELVDLLDASREANLRRGITGLLLYRQQEFMQLLEGDRSAIFQLYETICADPRNRNNYLMWEGAIEQRSFPDWSMAFLAPNELELQSWPGYSDFFGTSYDAMAHRGNASTGKRFLLWHREAFLRQQHRGTNGGKRSGT